MVGYSGLVGKLPPWLAAKLPGGDPSTSGMQVFATAELPSLLSPAELGERSPSAVAAPPVPGGGGGGGPAARTLSRIKSPDGYFVSGLWDCTAGTLEITFDFDELVHIIEGEVTVRANGVAEILVPGSVAFFRNGLVTTWEISHYVRKMYVHRYPRHSLASRAVRKLIRLAR